MDQDNRFRRYVTIDEAHTIVWELHEGIGQAGSKGRSPLFVIKNKKSTPSWSLYSDPEMKRKKRVATYKVFTVEGKVKQTVRSGCRWLKAKYIEMRYGWW
ncbi:unnamed protein product [Sphagnum troendelagicum]